MHTARDAQWRAGDTRGVHVLRSAADNDSTSTLCNDEMALDEATFLVVTDPLNNCAALSCLSFAACLIDPVLTALSTEDPTELVEDVSSSRSRSLSETGGAWAPLRLVGLDDTVRRRWSDVVGAALGGAWRGRSRGLAGIACHARVSFQDTTDAKNRDWGRRGGEPDNSNGPGGKGSV